MPVRRIGTLEVAALVLAGLVFSLIARSQSLDHVAIPGASPVPLAPRPLEGAAALAAYFDGLVEQELREKPVAGAVVVVVKDGQVIFSKGYGYSNLMERIPVDPTKTLFGVGSISKLFTWTGVMQLVEQGRIRLDTDVNQYLKGYRVPETHSALTMRNLLTHTGGFEDDGVGVLYAGSPQDYLPLGQYLFKHVPARVRPPTTDFTDGTGCAYSNWGASLAGLIVQTTSGVPFDEYMERYIFKPLGMSSSSFREPLPPELAARVSVSYVFDNGELVPQDSFQGIHNLAPAGALMSTGADMAKFMIAMLQEGQLEGARILGAATVQDMFRRHLSGDPALNGMDLGFFDTWINGHHIVEHGGDTHHFHSWLSMLPEEHVGLFVSINTAGSAADTANQIDRAFLTGFFPARLPQIQPAKDAAETVGRYVGAYRIDTRSYTKFDKVLVAGGDLNVEATPDGGLLFDVFPFGRRAKWVDVGRGVFRDVGADSFVAFKEGKDGHGMYLLTAFPPFTFTRVPWYGTALAQSLVLIVSVLLQVSIVVTAIRRRRADLQRPFQLRWARSMLAVTGILLVAAVIGVAAVLLGDSHELVSRIPAALYFVLTLPLFAIPLTAASALCAIQAWREGAWTFAARLQYSASLLGAFALLWLLEYWNLVGYWFD
jgi:CubicO group peptidase (beta-lactamase class C family)